MIYILLTYLFFPAFWFYNLIKKIIRKNRSIPKKILVIQTAKIGDFICSTPIFREIKKRYPEIELTVMVNPITKELAEVNPYIDKIIVVDVKNYRGFFGKIKLAKIIRDRKYDIGIALNPNVYFAIALFWGLVPKRISIMPNFSGITFKLGSKFFTYLEKHEKGQLLIKTYLKMLKAIDITSNNISKEVYAIESAFTKVQKILNNIKKPIIGIAVSSGNKLKELTKEKLIELIKSLLNELDIYIVLIGSQSDKQKAKEILSFLNSKEKERTIDTTGMFNLKELPALIRRLSLFIGVDTGITYMANALSIPIVHIAGPIDTSEQRPTGEEVIVIQPKISCIPCSYVFKTSYRCKKNIRECIELIETKDIIREIKTLLSKRLITKINDQFNV